MKLDTEIRFFCLSHCRNVMKHSPHFHSQPVWSSSISCQFDGWHELDQPMWKVISYLKQLFQKPLKCVFHLLLWPTVPLQIYDYLSWATYRVEILSLTSESRSCFSFCRTDLFIRRKSSSFSSKSPLCLEIRHLSMEDCLESLVQEKISYNHGSLKGTM